MFQQLAAAEVEEGYGPPADMSAVQGDTPQQAAPAAPAAETPAAADAAPPSPWRDVVAPKPKAPPLTPEVLEVLKGHGIDDLEQFVLKGRTAEQQAEILKQEKERLAAIYDGEQSLDELTREVIQMAREGKNVIAWAKQQPEIDLLKPANKVPKLDMVLAFAKEAFSPEEVQRYRDQDDPEFVAQFEKRLDQWHTLAVAKFEQARTAPIQEREAKRREEKEFAENYHKAVAANPAYIQQHAPSVLSKVTPEVLSDFASGKLVRDLLCLTDGKTPKPSALFDLLYLQNRETILKEAEEAGYARGVEEGMHRMGQALPTSAAQANRMRSNPEQMSAREAARAQTFRDLRPE